MLYPLLNHIDTQRLWTESFSGLDPKGVRRELSKIREVANAITKEMERLYKTQKEPQRGEAR